MILCNLAAIMGERRLKISKVAADTGISRTTLTALYYDSGKGVQFETAKKVVEHRFFDALTVELKAKDDVTRDELDDFLFSSYTCEFPERFLGAIEI